MFQNNLLKMDVHKTPLGGVKVTLYTTKPYKDAIVVNKKSDNEYVILMPETASTLTSKPALNSTADVLTKIDVKTQQYGSTQGQKGYTKIVISTLKPVEITPQIETLGVSQYKLSETETKELLEQAGKKQVITPAKPSQKVVAKTTVPQVAKTAAKPQTVEKSAQKVVQKDTAPIQKQAQKVTQLAAKKPAAAEKTVTKKIAEPVKVAETKPAKTVTESATKTTQPEEVTKPAEVETITEEKSAEPQKPIPTPIKPIATEKYGRLQQIIAALSSDQNTTIILVGLIPVIILLLILMVIRKSKSQAATGRFKQGPSTTGTHSGPKNGESASTYIHEDMDWKEKFKAYKSQPAPTEPPTEEHPMEETPFEEIPIQYGVEEEEEEVLELEDLFAQKDTDNAFNVTVETGNEPKEDEQEDAIWDEFVGPEPSVETSIEDLFNEEEFGDDLWEEQPIEEVYDTYKSSEALAEDTAKQNEFSFDRAFESVQENPSQETEPYFEDHHFDLEEEEDETQLSTKSSFQIDDSKGFHLINFEGATALVGYINEEIFVLKRFEETTQSKLKARLSENTGNAASYIVRVGNFKALIEVTPQKMNFLLEL
jgi:hypothetical protein